MDFHWDKKDFLRNRNGFYSNMLRNGGVIMSITSEKLDIMQLCEVMLDFLLNGIWLMSKFVIIC